MCYVYASTDPARYRSTTRSIRLHGCVTSVRLENEFWEILEGLAAEQSYSVSEFIGELYSEVLTDRGEVTNLASMLRVACAIYLGNRHGKAPTRRIPAAPSPAELVADSA